MDNKVKRVFVEKKHGYDIEAQALLMDIRENLDIKGLTAVRIINRYDVEGITDEEYFKARNLVFSEPPVDLLYDEAISFSTDEKVFAIEYLPGQYDQRADSASQCIQLLTSGERPECRTAKLIVLKGIVTEDEFERIKKYCVNPVECREASMDKPDSLKEKVETPESVDVLKGFIGLDEKALEGMVKEMGLAMSLEDLAFCREYFRDIEKRDPTITEIKVLDTYWSDHCRHTTFLTGIKNVSFEKGTYSHVISGVYCDYTALREKLYKDKEREMCLMDLATIAMKELKLQGKLNDLDESDEINACSIKVNADIDGNNEEWLVMFKNETHNHPTEIEPFGGAATCLGGAIRDPLSGRVYVYQAMRVTGSGDPRARVEDTVPGKLPQRKITTVAAAGYSSYGNQIGLSTGQVAEVYHDDFIAKRMEIGAVIGAAPAKNVIRSKPEAGDVVILLGGRTGRDGCGGATGSSKAHTEESLVTCGAEVQKGNPPTERKIQRLFRNSNISTMIKRCNDFGAGGVSVAIGELADSLDIDLDQVPKKYEGLDGTELAISESQERMAVVVSRENAELFIRSAREENLEAVIVAEVTSGNRLRMKWKGRFIVDISRDFLNTNGVRQHTDVIVLSPGPRESYLKKMPAEIEAEADDLQKAWLSNLKRLDVCGQKGLAERFDSTIGAGTVLMPFGGAHQLSPAEGMAAKLPLLKGDTTTGTLMTYGYNPHLSKWSPFHGAVYSIVEACTKIAAMGGDYKKVRLTLQEYFEKLGNDPVKWGKPFSALLGAFMTQMKLGIPSIGGKDSMSGSFKDMNVPPTLVAFAVTAGDITKTVSTEFKKSGSTIAALITTKDEMDLPDFDMLKKNLDRLNILASEGRMLAASSIREGGIAAALSRMCFGNMIGADLQCPMDNSLLFKPLFGSVIIEIPEGMDVAKILEGLQYIILGKTIDQKLIRVNNTEILLKDAVNAWTSALERIFPTNPPNAGNQLPEKYTYFRKEPVSANIRIQGAGKPRVFMPVFPGTNCEYDTARAFEKAGAEVELFVVRNLDVSDIEMSVEAMTAGIDRSQIIMLPGGFSGGDEPDGSGKFIATAFRNPYVKESVMRLLKNRDGLILGICNGFQALIKLGLVPYGEIRDISDDSPTLTFNTIGRHVSCMVRTRVASNLSPWLMYSKPGDVHVIPVSHGEGRFVAAEKDIRILAAAGQIATQYADMEGNPAYDIRFNPNGSMQAVEGITSPDGRVFGKMGHSERIGSYVAQNIPGVKDQKIFEAGVAYFL